MTWEDLRHARVMRALVAVVVITTALTGVASAGVTTDPQAGVAATGSLQLRVAQSIEIGNEYYATWKVSYRCPSDSGIGLDGGVSQDFDSVATSGSAPIDLECSGRWDTFVMYLSYPTGEPTGLTPGKGYAWMNAHTFGGETYMEAHFQKEVRVK